MKPTIKQHSPFLVIQDFISPLQCEQIVDKLGCIEPDFNVEQKPIVTTRRDEACEQLIYNEIQERIGRIQEHFDFEYRGMKPVQFYWYAEEFEGDDAFTCDNSTYKDKKWIKNKDRDFSCILFLSDHNTVIPFDSDYEVYGGKIEFPQHQFGFNAERGTLIVFPSDPHFLHRVEEVMVGDLFYGKFFLAAKTPYLYDPQMFPGDYTSWFNEIA